MPKPKRVMKELKWHDECLAAMQANLVNEQRALHQQMHRVVSLEQDITCLDNLLKRARSRGETELPLDYRETEFRGRRP